jgi:ATP-dependent DNA helicase RecG
MKIEDCNTEYKSLKKVSGKKADLKTLAETLVCLANAQGGTIFIGVENNNLQPPENQIINQELVNDVLSRLRSLTDSVGIGNAIIETHSNGGQYFYFKVFPTTRTIATTSSGKILIRIQDKCYPVSGDELTRLAAEKNAFQWELIEHKSINISHIPAQNIANFVNDIRKSERVKDSVKNKDDFEILEHYNLINNGILTNLGALWLGSAKIRSKIAYPVTVQYIVYDEYDEKIKKEVWNDYELNPKELIIDIEAKANELKYFHELSSGLFRKQVRQYAPEVIRELLINAFAHKKYTISGDVFIEVYPDRLEITNPGSLPLGITEDNILHTTHRRNPHLIRIFHDLNLMEGEGSGFDLIYELDSRDNKPFPVVKSDFDYTKVIQSAKIIDEQTLLLLDYLNSHYQFTQKQLIALGIIAREKKILGTKLIKQLQLKEDERLRSYVAKLEEMKIVVSRGIRKGKQYLINPELIKSAKLNVKPNLKTIEPYRLEALIESDLKTYPNSSIRDIHKRLPDVDFKDLQKTVYKLVKDGKIKHTPDKTYRKYFLA